MGKLEDILLKPIPEQDDEFRWYVVTSTSPLRVRRSGEVNELPLAPETLVEVKVGDRVWGQLNHHQLIILGVSKPITTKPMFRGYLAATQSINGNVWSAVTFSQDYAVDGAFTQNGHSSNRIVPKDGYWRVRAKGSFSGSVTTGIRHVGVWKNASAASPSTGTLLEWGHGTAGGMSGHVYKIAEWRGPLVAGDSVSWGAWHDGGTALDMIGNASGYYTNFEMEWLRPL